MKITCFSDTHGNHTYVDLPRANLLIFAGDFTGQHGHKEHAQLITFLRWMDHQPHRHKIMIAGNHDFIFEGDMRSAAVEAVKERGIHYLEDDYVMIDGWKIWGTPVQPVFFNWAFNREPEIIKKHMDLIPDDVDILITHAPPYGILDLCGMPLERKGCKVTAEAVERVKPCLHVFGHIHESNGREKIGITRYVNASIGYRAEHKPIVVRLQE